MLLFVVRVQQVSALTSKIYYDFNLNTGTIIDTVSLEMNTYLLRDD